MSSAMDENEMKKTKGRQRIEFKKIEKKSRLQVAFTKRRNGLFKKARELNILSGAQVAIITLSPGNKVFAFGGSSVDSVIDRFKKEELNMGTVGEINTVLIGDESKMNYQYGSETSRKIEGKKNINIECEQGNAKFYCDKPIDNMQLDELEKYSKSLQELKNNLLNRVNELQDLPSSSSPSNLFALSNQDSKFKFDDSLLQSHILDLDDFNEDHISVLEEIRASLIDEESLHCKRF